METCNAAHLRYLLAVAHHHATRAGLPSDDADDCAITFVETHLAAAPPPGTRCPEAWWNTCVRNHAADYQRALTRRRQHECPWPGTVDSNGLLVPFDLPGNGLAPGAALFQDECWRQMFVALRELNDTQRESWTRRFLLEEPVKQIARTMGKTPEAVRKIISRAGKHIAASLLGAGWTQADVCRCLPPPRVVPVAGSRRPTRTNNTKYSQNYPSCLDCGRRHVKWEPNDARFGSKEQQMHKRSWPCVFPAALIGMGLLLGFPTTGRTSASGREMTCLNASISKLTGKVSGSGGITGFSGDSVSGVQLTWDNTLIGNFQAPTVTGGNGTWQWSAVALAPDTTSPHLVGGYCVITTISETTVPLTSNTLPVTPN